MDIEKILFMLAERIETGFFWVRDVTLSKQLYLSPSFYKIWGVSREEIFRNPESWIDSVFPEYRNLHNADKMLSEYRAHGKNARYDIIYRIAHSDGTTRWMQDVSFPLYDGNDQCIAFAGIVNDITPLKKQEIKLIDAQKRAESASKTKSEFIANMSHDLRTPMSGISGMLESLLYVAEDAKAELESRQQYSVDLLKSILEDFIAKTCEYTKIAQGSTHELLRLFNDILEVVRLESGKLELESEPFDLHALLKKSIVLLKSVADHKHLELTLSVSPSVPHYIRAFKKPLNRTLLNLLSNALKFTETGSVKLVVTPATDQRKTTYHLGEAVVLQIAVFDTGIGIPEDKFEIIFEHFSRLTSSYQGVYQGSGLGLYTVAQYVHAMQGKIDVTSEVGKGSCFTVTLPVTVAQPIPQQIVGAEPADALIPPLPFQLDSDEYTSTTASFGEVHILLVEDNYPAAIAVCNLLKHLECSVDHAKNGKEAINLASQGAYDLIFMDVGLPDLNGLEVTQAIRALPDEKKSKVPILALTGHADHERREQCLLAGMNDVLIKPAQRLTLQAALKEWIFDSDEIDDEELTPLPVIDWAGHLDFYQGSREEALIMLNLLRDDLHRTRQIIIETYEKRDIKGLRDELHRALGGVVYVRTPQLEEAIRDFQRAVKTESLDSDRTNKLYHATLLAIENFWSTLKASNFS